MSYTWILKVTVDPVWVADGFDLSDPERVRELEESLIPLSYPGEVKIEVVEAPDPESILIEQGY